MTRLRRSSGLSGAAAGASVLLSGDAGIGKSRLVAELAAEAVEADRLVIAGHCVGAGGDTLAWLPFVELVAELTAAAPDLVDELLEEHASLAALRPGFAAGPPPTDPGLIAEAVHSLLTEAARDRPLLVVIEDVHWADHSSRDLLTLLLTRGFGTPVTLVVTYRSDDLHRRHPLHDVLTVWTRLPLLARIDLGPLPDEPMLRLVRGLEDAPGRGDRAQDVVSRAEGNPFFAEELVAGGDTTGGPTLDLARLLRVRLDRLDEPARQLVRAVALGGRTVSPDLLAEVTGLDPDTLDDALHQALDHHILEQTAGGDFRFRHSLLGETVADELLPGARRRLHLAWLEALRGRPDRGSPSDVARHAAATGDTETATSAAIEAGDEALRVGGARDALRLYEAALGWIVHDPQRRARVALAASGAARTAGDQMRSLGLLEETLADTGDDVDPPLRAQLLVRTAAWYTVLDLPGDPLSLSEEAVSLLPQPRDEASVDILVRHLEILVNLRHDDEATRVGDEIALLAEELDLPAAAAGKRLQQARQLSRTDPVSARRGLVATADDVDAPAALRLSALLRLGTLELGEGRLGRAHDYFVAGTEIADRRNRPWGPFGMECRLQAGRTAYELGRWPEAERLLASPADLPHPPRGFMEGALVELLVARGDEVDPARLDETIRWWEVDVLLVVACLGGLIDLLARADQGERLMHVVSGGLDTIERAWGDESQAIIRITALYTGAVADLAERGHDVVALRERGDHFAGRVDSLVTHEAERIGPESRAWVARLEDERVRLPAALGERSDADAAVRLWQTAADSFAALGNLPEHARSAVRLSGALRAAGDATAADTVATAARAEATELGARPLLELLDELTESPADPAPGLLTPRELEVLEYLDRGRTNGQIAEALFISRKTASVHVSNILAKLDASTRGEAVAHARRQGLLGTG